MLRTFRVRNFKSIEDVTIELGRVNVIIGENGAGKSNLLEAFAFAGASAAGRAGHEFLASRGIRSPDPRMMVQAFEPRPTDRERARSAPDAQSAPFEASAFTVEEEGKPGVEFVTSWRAGQYQAAAEPTADDAARAAPDEIKEAEAAAAEIISVARMSIPDIARVKDQLVQILAGHRNARSRVRSSVLTSFLIYAPEPTALRTFMEEGQILPLGVRGEGLFKLLSDLESSQARQDWADINTNLRMLDWFDGLETARDAGPNERRLAIKDRYLSVAKLDQRSTNEAFLYLLFYFALFVAKDTPPFFAIDNIDASLNPALCRELMMRLVKLAAKHKKQVLLTTHNAALLDGLDLTDVEQRLFVASRDNRGRTVLRRVPAPKAVRERPPVPLSEAFVRGYLGGLPKNF